MLYKSIENNKHVLLFQKTKYVSSEKIASILSVSRKHIQSIGCSH